MKTFFKRTAMTVAFIAAALGLYFGIAVHGDTFNLATQIATILFGFAAPGLMLALFAVAVTAAVVWWRNRSRKVIAVLGATSLVAGTILAVDLGIYANAITSQNGSYNLLTAAANGALKRDEPVEKVVYANRDGKDLTISVYEHERMGESLAPVYVYIHGGGWVSGTPEDMGNLHTTMADAGYVTFSISYRLAPQGKVDNPTWDKAIADVEDAMQWVRENAAAYGGDASRLVLSGESAGGNLALLYSGKVSGGELEGPVPNAVAVMFPATDLYDIRNRGRYFTPDVIPMVVEPYIGGNLEDYPERVESVTPVNFLNPNLPPTLIIHGKNDSLVPIDGSRNYATAAQAQGLNATLVELPFSNHGTDAQANSSMILNMLEQIEGMQP